MENTGKEKTNSLRRLDFEKFLRGDADAQQEFCRDLGDALSSIGFIKLINHGISDEDLEKVFEWNAKFFSLTAVAKEKAANSKQPDQHRGYSYVGQEKLSRVRDFEKGHLEERAVHDVKESFDHGAAHDAVYPNRWPGEADLPGFRAFMERFYEKCQETHMQLLRAIALSLSLPPTYLQKLCDQDTSDLRLNHYPPIDVETVRIGATRISEHTDYGTVTLLFQDSIGGLEVEDQAEYGRYFPVSCDSRSEMIVNIGDCLQRWTNDKLRSTSHRVMLPPDVEQAGDRYSIAYFGKPNRNQTVGALSEFTQAGAVPKYEHVSSLEYNQQKLIRTY